MSKERAEAIIGEIRTLGSDADRAGMARFGIETERAFGVSMAQLRPLAKTYKPDHDLALALWQSGWHEARLLAVLIDDWKQVTKEQMDDWAGDFDSWDLCDQACLKLFVKTPYVEDQVEKWIEDERTFVRRAGFALIASYAVHGKTVPDENFLPFLDMIDACAADSRNYVKKSVNWALRQIGKRSLALHGPAVALAERLRQSEDRTERWVGRDAYKELTDPVQIDRISRKK